MRKIFLTASLILICSGCGVNVYSPLAFPDSEEYHLEEARIHLADGNFRLAEQSLANIKSPTTGDKDMLTVAIRLGRAELGFFDIITNLIELLNNSKNSSSSSSGAAQFFDLLNASEVYGTGENRENRMAALSGAIDILSGSSHATTETENLGCLLAGILFIPRIADITVQMTTTTDELKKLDVNELAQADPDNCPATTSFDNSLDGLITIQADISKAMAEVTECPFFEALSKSSDLTVVQTMINNLQATADQGCEVTVCADGDLICELAQTSCLQKSLNAEEAVAGDGIISRCELIQNCGSNPAACFGS